MNKFCYQCGARNEVESLSCGECAYEFKLGKKGNVVATALRAEPREEEEEEERHSGLEEELSPTKKMFFRACTVAFYTGSAVIGLVGLFFAWVFYQGVIK